MAPRYGKNSKKRGDAEGNGKEKLSEATVGDCCTISYILRRTWLTQHAINNIFLEIAKEWEDVDKKSWVEGIDPTRH